MTPILDENGNFTENWRDEGLPRDLQAEASLADFKNVGALAKAFVDTKKALGERVKLPADDAGKKAFLKEHFQPLLDADAEARRAAAVKEQESAQQQAQQQAEAEAAKQREAAQVRVKQLLGGTDGTAFDKNMELARRAMRHDKMPQIVKDALAAAVEAEGFEKVSDEQIRTVLGTDPIMAALAQAYGSLLQDGSLAASDGNVGGGGDGDEQAPMQPETPQIYNGLPDSHPVIVWFKRRGYKFENGRYVGREAV